MCDTVALRIHMWGELLKQTQPKEEVDPSLPAVGSHRGVTDGVAPGSRAREGGSETTGTQTCPSKEAPKESRDAQPIKTPLGSLHFKSLFWNDLQRQLMSDKSLLNCK